MVVSIHKCIIVQERKATPLKPHYLIISTAPQASLCYHTCNNRGFTIMYMYIPFDFLCACKCRLHYAVSAYKELLLHVQEMIQSKDDTVVQSSKVILSNLLYHPEYRDVFVMLLRNYNESVVQLSFLQDVIEMTHVYLRLVKLYSKQNGQLVIQKKKKRTSAKRKNNSQQPPTEDQLMEIWESLESEIQHVITNTTDASELPCPFDGASDTPIEEQK